MNNNIIVENFLYIAVAWIIDYGNRTLNTNKHTVDFSDYDYGYIVSHKGYYTNSYLPNRRWTLKLTGLLSTYLKIEFETKILAHGLDLEEYCSDRLRIKTAFARDICMNSSGIIYFNLSEYAQDILFIFQTNSYYEEFGFWLSLQGRHDFP